MKSHYFAALELRIYEYADKHTKKEVKNKGGQWQVIHHLCSQSRLVKHPDVMCWLIRVFKLRPAKVPSDATWLALSSLFLTQHGGATVLMDPEEILYSLGLLSENIQFDGEFWHYSKLWTNCTSNYFSFFFFVIYNQNNLEMTWSKYPKQNVYFMDVWPRPTLQPDDLTYSQRWHGKIFENDKNPSWCWLQPGGSMLGEWLVMVSGTKTDWRAQRLLCAFNYKQPTNTTAEAPAHDSSTGHTEMEYVMATARVYFVFFISVSVTYLTLLLSAAGRGQRTRKKTVYKDRASQTFSFQRPQTASACGQGLPLRNHSQCEKIYNETYTLRKHFLIFLHYSIIIIL